MKLKKIFKSWKIWLLIFCLVIAFLSINPQLGATGVVINSIEKNSSADIAGMTGPGVDIRPTGKETIQFINDIEINDLQGYYAAINNFPSDTILNIKTDQAEYSLLKQENVSLGIFVADAPGSNILKGLELQGGTRVLLSPIGDNVSDSDIKDVMEVLQNRLNVYGLTDLTVKAASDLEGGKYILVEIAGASQADVKKLVEEQGKFEAKIGDDVVFGGGKQDITFVCRTDGTCSRISACNPSSEDGYICKFEFEIGLSEEAATTHAAVTNKLDINYTDYGQQILSKKIDFYLDGKQVDSLNIAADLKGQSATQILITGSGVGKDKNAAINDAIKKRNQLQTILITGSLPTDIQIVKLDSISPSLGKQFINNIWLVGLIAVLAVGLVTFVRYRSIKVILPMIFSMLCEIFMILGFAALFKYNLDLAAIAGILASVGTGVDDLIVITDESLSKESENTNLKDRIKNAFFIVFVAYTATVAAMIPLFSAGAGLLTGFALVTIVGVTVGVFVARPVYAEIVRVLLE